ncbi:MAG: dual specificity protein phosphatase family protein [Vicinamibacterales bacterium]
MQFKRTLLSTLAVTVLVTGPSFVSITAHASDSTSRPVATVNLSRISIGNFGQINANYYRGEQPEGRDYANLAAIGIKTVIDLQADGDSNEERIVEANGMKFYRFPMTTHVPPTSQQITKFLEIVNDPAQQPVYVHCKGGKHRTGVMTAVYRMEQDSWNAERAFSEMKRYKFGADFLHSEFKQFVYGYRPTRTLVAEATTVTK